MFNHAIVCRISDRCSFSFKIVYVVKLLRALFWFAKSVFEFIHYSPLIGIQLIHANNTDRKTIFKNTTVNNNNYDNDNKKW